MIDAKRYVRLKPQGVTSITKTNSGFFLVFKRFEPETGQEIPEPEVQTFVLDDLNKRVSDLKHELFCFESVIEDTKLIS
jgi:hypothetical protein